MIERFFWSIWSQKMFYRAFQGLSNGILSCWIRLIIMKLSLSNTISFLRCGATPLIFWNIPGEKKWNLLFLHSEQFQFGRHLPEENVLLRQSNRHLCRWPVPFPRDWPMKVASAIHEAPQLTKRKLDKKFKWMCFLDQVKMAPSSTKKTNDFF